MTDVSILVRHSGYWITDNVYDGYKIEGIVIDEHASFKELTEAIAIQLDIDRSRKKIHVRFIVEGNATPMEIHNDMGVKLYVSLKKNVAEFTKYPLCITTTDLEIGCNSSVEGSFDSVTGAIECIEDIIPNRLGLVVVNDVEALSAIDMDHEHMISDPNNKLVQENQLYKNKATIVSVMHKYAIDNRFQFKSERSDRKSYFLKCHCEGCPWTFRSSCVGGSTFFKVREFYDKHTCPMADRRFTQRQATIAFVGGLTVAKIRNHKRKHTPNDVIEDVKENLGVDINYQKAWRAKERAEEIVRGKPADGYKQMPRYLYMLGSVYPNSYIKMHKSPQNEFLYVFIALYPFIRGFDYCRPTIVVDGSHLGAAYKGTFLSASTLDGAGCIFPLAYGVVDSENDASWTWFFEQFKSAFGVRPNMAVVSDRNESIWKSVRVVFPSVPHLACVWHVWKNVCTNFRRSKKTLTEVFYAMAKAYRRDDFEDLMDKVGKMDHRVKDYLVDVGYEKWARVYSPVNRGRMMTSNIAECINSRLVDARELPILEFLEQVRILYCSWNCKNGEKARYTGTPLGNRFQEILELNEIKSTRLTVKVSSEFLYSVTDDGRRYIVCLEKKTCTCGRFQMDEIPCSHALAVLRSKNITDLKPYCSDYHKAETLVKTYELPVPPVPDKKDWNAPVNILEELVLPPRYKRQAGRPKKGRFKKMSETLSSSTNCCGRCGRQGHNRRSCNFFPIQH